MLTRVAPYRFKVRAISLSVLPVVITSGYITDNLRTDARSAGVRQLLQKEYTLEQLGPLLQQVLADAGRSHPGG